MNTRYATVLHIMVVIGSAERGTKTCSRWIAESLKTNPSLVRRLLRPLREAGLVETEEGREGGVWLSRDARKISLLEIYDATEQGPLLGINPKQVNPGCPVSKGVKPAVDAVYGEVEEQVRRTLRRRTLADLLISVQAESVSA